jgi:microcystin degradation protein MlrC
MAGSSARKKIVIARFQHETNTFSPIPTPLEAFNPVWDGQVIERDGRARTAVGAFIQLAQAMGAELITPVSAMANPSATVHKDAYELVCKKILDAVSEGCDAILLDLHGAMVAQGAPDGEGELLARIRAIAPSTPLIVALDLHANLTPKMVANCDVIVSFKTYPHVDMFEAGEHAGRIFSAMLGGVVKPVMAYRQLPLLSHTLCSNTEQGAMQAAVQAAIQAEKLPGVLAVSILAGFSLADFHDAGMSVLVVTDQDQTLAEGVADKLAAQIIDNRDGFIYQSPSLTESLQNARTLANGSGFGPVLLLDHSDNVMSGGTCDTMDVLAAALEQGLSGIAVGPIADPETVVELVKAGVGARVTVALGNKAGWSSLGKTHTPYKLSGVIKAISDGRFVVTGPIFTGALADMGQTVVLDTGTAQIVITTERIEPYDLGVFSSCGVTLADKTYILLKSRIYCRPVFVPMSKGLVECDSDEGGPTSSNYAWFDFKHVRRPIYPFDLS